MNKLLFLFFLSTLLPVQSLYVTPNEVVVTRGNNYSFDAISSVDFAKYTITCDGETIIFQSKRNLSNIHIDYIVPSIMELRIFKFLIITYDVYNYQLDNTTYRFTIGNLTDLELFNLFDELASDEDTIDTLQDALNNSTNASGWLNYKYTTVWGEHSSTLVLIITVVCICLSFMGVALAKIKHTSSEQTKEAKLGQDKAEKNHAKAQLTKQAVSYCMDIYVEETNEGKSIQRKLLGEFEGDAVKQYNNHYDACYFLRSDKNMRKTLNKKKKDITSIDVIKYRLKALQKDDEKPNYLTWWLVASAIVRYLNETGHILRNDNLFPVGCSIDKIKQYLGELYDEKEKAALKVIDESHPTKDDTKQTFNTATKQAQAKTTQKRKTQVDQIDPEIEAKNRLNDD